MTDPMTTPPRDTTDSSRSNPENATVPPLRKNEVEQAEARFDPVADGQTWSGVRCELCGVVRMRGMESRDGVVRCQEWNICEQVVALVASARSTYADLIEAGWISPTQAAADRPAQRAEGGRSALNAAADQIRFVRENGLPEGVESHPTAEHFEAWLRERGAQC